MKENVSVAPVATTRDLPPRRGDQLLAARVELGLGQPLRRGVRERRDLRDRPSLQLRRLLIEPELGRGRHEPGVKSR